MSKASAAQIREYGLKLREHRHQASYSRSLGLMRAAAVYERAAAALERFMNNEVKK